MRTDAINRLNTLPRGLIAVLLLSIVSCMGFLFYFAVNPGSNWQLFLMLLLLLPAVSLAFLDSKYLLPYALSIWTFAPLLRRIIDWQTGDFQKFPILSLAPLLVTSLLLLAMLRRPIRLPLYLQKPFGCFAFALLYAGAVGLVRSSVASLYDFGNYTLPMLLLLYMATRPADTQERDKIFSTIATLAVIVAAYGWIQFVFAPPWDTFWMRKVQTIMISNGLPEPGKIKVFSTLNASGTLAGFLAAALVPMLLEKRWRGIFGWFGVIIVASTLALTLVRAMYILVPIFLIVYILQTSGVRKWRMAISVVLLSVGLYVVLPFLPGAGNIIRRFESLSNIGQDRSFNFRSSYLPTVLPKIFNDPVGLGIGGTGVSTKLTNGGHVGEDAAIDNGYLAIFYTFGIVGGLVYFSGFALLYIALRRQSRETPQLADQNRLAVATFVFYIGLLMFGNPMNSLVGLMFWLFTANALGKPVQEAVPVEPLAAPGKRRLSGSSRRSLSAKRTSA